MNTEKLFGRWYPEDEVSDQKTPRNYVMFGTDYFHRLCVLLSDSGSIDSFHVESRFRINNDTIEYLNDKGDIIEKDAILLIEPMRLILLQGRTPQSYYK